jgi:hypothetical protein
MYTATSPRDLAVAQVKVLKNALARRQKIVSTPPKSKAVANKKK